MITLHPEFLTRDGKKAFAVLPIEEFVALQEILHDVEDLLDLREAKREEGTAEAIPLAQVKEVLGLD